MLVTESGIVTDSSDVQSKKAPRPILVTVSGIISFPDKLLLVKTEYPEEGTFL